MSRQFNKLLLVFSIIFLSQANADVKSKINASPERPVYLVAQINVVDQKKYFSGYGSEVVKYLPFGNAEVLVATQKPAELLEGEWAHNWNVVVKFPSAADFDKFYLNEKYQQLVKPMRLETTDMNNIVLFEGGPNDNQKEEQPPVYFMAKLKIDDKEKFFGAYVSEVSKHVRAGGGKVRFGGYNPKQLEGVWGDYWTIFIEFPSQKDFDLFYRSEGNLKVAIPIRYQATSENNTVIFNGGLSRSNKRKKS